MINVQEELLKDYSKVNGSSFVKKKSKEIKNAQQIGDLNSSMSNISSLGSPFNIKNRTLEIPGFYPFYDNKNALIDFNSVKKLPTSEITTRKDKSIIRLLKELQHDNGSWSDLSLLNKLNIEYPSSEKKLTIFRITEIILLWIKKQSLEDELLDIERMIQTAQNYLEQISRKKNHNILDK